MWAYRIFAWGCALAIIGATAAARPLHLPQPQTHPAAVASRPAPPPQDMPAHAHGLLTSVMLADLGFSNGFRLANLGERRDVFVSMPEGADITADELTLVFDDMSAYDAHRSLEILVNDRTAASIPLDGHTTGRLVHVRLGDAKPQHGYLRFTFVYSGAATKDRCIDVRYVGDSLTIRPETAVAVNVDFPGHLDVGTTTALLPRQVMVALPNRALTSSEIATALTLARSLTASGRRVAFQLGFDGLRGPPKPDAPRQWDRGLILIGSLDDVSGVLDAPLERVAGLVPTFGTLAAAHVGGFPALIVSDINSGRAARLFSSPVLSATRGIAQASVGDMATPALPVDRVTFDQLVDKI